MGTVGDDGRRAPRPSGTLGASGKVVGIRSIDIRAKTGFQGRADVKMGLKISSLIDHGIPGTACGSGAGELAVPGRMQEYPKKRGLYS